MPPERVRAQLAAQHGGADVVFDAKGQRTGGARPLTVVTLRPGETGRHYRLPTERDLEAVRKAQERFAMLLDDWRRGGEHGLYPEPNEQLPTPPGKSERTEGAYYNFMPLRLYGFDKWKDMFSIR